jgi:hypothetical protein
MNEDAKLYPKEYPAPQPCTKAFSYSSILLVARKMKNRNKSDEKNEVKNCAL